MGSYFDPDGLYRKYGIKKVIPDTGGEYKTYGDFREVEIGIDLTKLNRNGDTPVAQTLATDYIQSDQIFFPVQGQNTTNAPQIVQVIVDTVVAAVGATATLSLGLISDVDRTTVLSTGNAGFLNAVPTATFVLGRTYFNTPAAGAGGLWIGSTPVAISGPFTTPFVGAGLIAARNTTALFTAGYINVKIIYNMQGTIQ